MKILKVLFVSLLIMLTGGAIGWIAGVLLPWPLSIAVGFVFGFAYGMFGGWVIVEEIL